LAISELEKAMANLPLGLAEIQNKEQHLDAAVHQFRTQLRRFPRQVIYGQTSPDASLTAMGEIEERLADAVASHRRLLQIKKTSSQELESLVVLKQVDEARTTLGDLKRRAASGTGDADTELEIRRLEEFIAANSKRAEQTITDRYQDDYPERASERY
jgi:hypothetical protein